MLDETANQRIDDAEPRGAAGHRELFAWVVYDWANSGYATLSITVLVAYLQNVVFPSATCGPTGAVVWAWGIALSMLLGAVLSPFLGAIADAQVRKRMWLAGTALCGAVASILLGVVPPGNAWVFVALFLCANLCFELSLTFYNGFLPEIVDEDDFNQVSAWGYGVGYVGGGIALLLVICIFVFGPSIGLTGRAEQLRSGLVLMGLWWGVFTLPAILFLRDRRATSRERPSLLQTAQRSWHDVAATIRNIRSYKMLALFLLAFLCYNDGIQTVLSQSSTFALQELKFDEDELLKLILMIQFAALPGSLIVGWLADKFGQKTVLVNCLLVWIFLLAGAYFVRSKFTFWMLGAAVAMVMGGTQSVSRAIMGVMTPREQSAKFFGFYNLSGKATGFLGAFLFGAIFAATGSARWAIVSLLIFFAIGTAIVYFVDVERGRQDQGGFTNLGG